MKIYAYLALVTLATPAHAAESVWDSPGSRAACVDDYAAKINDPHACGAYVSGSPFLLAGDRDVTAEARKACERYYREVFTSLHLSCEFQDEAETLAKQSGDQSTARIRLAEQWKKNIYAQKDRLDQSGVAYVKALQGLAREARHLLAEETEAGQCGRAGVSTSLVYYGFVATRALGLKVGFETTAQFMARMFYETSAKATIQRRAKWEKERNDTLAALRIGQTPADRPSGVEAEGLGTHATHAARDMAIGAVAEKTSHTLGHELLAEAAGPLGSLAMDGTLRLLDGEWDVVDTAFFGLKAVLYGTGVAAVAASGPAAPVSSAAVGWTVTALDTGLTVLETIIHAREDKKLAEASQKLLALAKKHGAPLDSGRLAGLYHEQEFGRACQAQ